MSEQPKIVVLDGHTLNPGDLSWNELKSLGEVDFYDRSTSDEIIPRAKDATILIVNKLVLTREHIEQLPRLRCICVSATGYNNVDLAAAREREIGVSNAVGYGTHSVAQHVFALLLELSNHVALHHQSVLNGDWSHQPDFSYWKKPLIELNGKTMGILGFGRIGQKVASIAMAMGMRVLATHRHPERDALVGVTFVRIEDLFAASDVVSLTVPLNDKTRQIVNAKMLQRMKPSAFLINTGRGELINESDLYQALVEEKLAGAGLDVLDGEPPRADHPLFDLPNCIITPHQAWASKEARQRLLDITVGNVASYLRGKPQNVVNA
ncbi:D-2-hydroxyacid dehydrogenase [Haliscomenobacter hydrossis]|uniref:Phosphoglycerate dehydrogenase n=1 Tax=Haliscomenobacter hydrossis (strain ATCC 27775 / DSM 1100 / LMG 10767 / O) TaxID=760192 RepID=F4L4X6_HALH1|nr:D-2-hydroxyacid dehydrogenase [Haliscomenobacter hydrossis]AEE54038.1 Phosphoglycerate dehydrogenase [Haliscomenobacter hydrossis DSM 1100]